MIDMAVREQGATAKLPVLHFRRRAARNSRCRQTWLRCVEHAQFRKIPRREGDVAEEGQWRRVVELRVQFIIVLYLQQLHLQGGRGVVHGKVKWGGKQKCAASGLNPAKLLPHRGDDTNASVRLHAIRYTSSKARKVL